MRIYIMMVLLRGAIRRVMVLVLRLWGRDLWMGLGWLISILILIIILMIVRLKRLVCLRCFRWDCIMIDILLRMW